MNRVSHDPPTEQSIASARAHQQQERAKVTAATGVQITDDGTPQHTRTPHRVACGLCNYAAHAKREGQAVNSVAAHIVRAHFPQHVKE